MVSIICSYSSIVRSVQAREAPLHNILHTLHRYSLSLALMNLHADDSWTPSNLGRHCVICVFRLYWLYPSHMWYLVRFLTAMLRLVVVLLQTEEISWLWQKLLEYVKVITVWTFGSDWKHCASRRPPSQDNCHYDESVLETTFVCKCCVQVINKIKAAINNIVAISQ